MSLVVFLRGVNVGRAKRFHPSALAKDLAHLGVTNLGAAGTFVVREPVRLPELRSQFLRLLPFSAEIMVCPSCELLKLAAAPPFPQLPASPDLRYFVSILARRPRKLPELPRSYPSGSQWQVRLVAVSGRYALCIWRRFGSSSLEPNTVIEKCLGVTATTRNWNTILRISALLQEMPPTSTPLSGKPAPRLSRG
jgi:uncharacterized protein (DUF1697 family)